MNRNADEKANPKRVWDLPLRLFHWSTVGAFSVALFTEGDSRYLHVHAFAGYLLLALVVFRLLWGWLGGHYARFAALSVRPAEALVYLAELRRGTARRHVGHNPAGIVAIWLLMGLLAALGLTGIVVLGAEEGHGPLAGLFAIETGIRWHVAHGWLGWTALAVVGIHLAGVAVESVFHRENLVGAMWHGRKSAPPDTPASPARPMVAASLAAAMAVFGGWYFSGWVAAAAEDAPYRPYVGRPLADNALWREECGACHLAFHPSLLPERSWERMFASTEDHFGENLFLSPDTVAALLTFHRRHAAEHSPTEAAWRTAHAVPADAAPQRVTGTPFWRATHDGIETAVFERPPVRSRTNCAACHADAEEGTFEDGAMRIPPSEAAAGGKE